MGATSQHFGPKDLSCHHCGRNECTQALVDGLEKLRAAISSIRQQDTPIFIDDAYRCPLWNSRTPNAAAHSQHMDGTAADIRVPAWSARQIYNVAVTISAFQGFGINDHSNYLHVDVRPNNAARWCYTDTGAVCPFYEMRAV